MVNNERRELLAISERLGGAFPGVRIGQVVANLSYLAMEPSNGAVWDVADAALLAAGRDLLKQWPASDESAAGQDASTSSAGS